MITLAQIGCGYWGPNLLRNYTQQPNCHVKYCADQVPERRKFIEANFPNTRAIEQPDAALEDADVQAIVVATPAATHFALARRALLAGKHVFVEKPMAMATAEVDELTALAKAGGRVLMVGHTFLYNPAVRFLKRMIENGELGDLYYLYSQRLNLGQVRADVNAWWNLAPHDVSILLYLMGDTPPINIAAQGVSFLQPNTEDVVFANLKWANGTLGHVQVSWLDPGKVRKLTLVGSKKMVVYDDVSDDKIAIFDRGFDQIPRLGEQMDFDKPAQMQLKARSGDIVFPRIDWQEPLKIEAAHFLECIRTGATPITGPEHARAVVAVLEAGHTALKTGLPQQLLQVA